MCGNTTLDGWTRAFLPAPIQAYIRPHLLSPAEPQFTIDIEVVSYVSNVSNSVFFPTFDQVRLTLGEFVPNKLNSGQLLFIRHFGFNVKLFYPINNHEYPQELQKE